MNQMEFLNDIECNSPTQILCVSLAFQQRL